MRMSGKKKMVNFIDTKFKKIMDLEIIYLCAIYIAAINQEVSEICI